MSMPLLLLVEDNEISRDLLSRRLKKRGYEVITAGDGRQAVACAQGGLPDLILMDLAMPVMDGLDATRQLRRKRETSSIPVIALTAHALPADRARAIAAGCDEYETKPVELEHLIQKIETLLAHGRESIH
jgi:two-component system, cell cycle response regulator DivK